MALIFSDVWCVIGQGSVQVVGSLSREPIRHGGCAALLRPRSGLPVSSARALLSRKHSKGMLTEVFFVSKTK